MLVNIFCIVVQQLFDNYVRAGIIPKGKKEIGFNAQYHDNIELYKEWFGEDNIENIKDKIIESAIVNWFEDEDAGIEKVWNYFRAI